jgi:uncharacterized protein (TIGR02118 family)
MIWLNYIRFHYSQTQIRTMLKLIVLYPQPTDPRQFDADYAAHLDMLHEKTGIPKDVKPYKVTKFAPTPQGAQPYYQMFSMPFDSPEALQGAMASAGMQEVAADANRISTGGPVTVLIGNEG